MNVASITEAAMSHGLKLGTHAPEVAGAVRLATRLEKRARIDAALLLTAP
jgi:hypothetical protein